MTDLLGVASGGSMDGVSGAVADDADADSYAATAADTNAAWSATGALDRSCSLASGPLRDGRC